MDILKSIKTKATPEDLLSTIPPKYTLEMLSFGGEDHLKAEGAAFGSSVEQLQDVLVALTMNTGNLISMSADEMATALNNMNSHRQVIKPIPKLNFNRPKIIHQVSTRKPKHLVKKIIR